MDDGKVAMFGLTGRQTLEVHADSAASAEAVWRLLADVTTWPQWSRFDKAHYEQEGTPPPHGVGAIRLLRAGRTRARDTVLEFDPPRRLIYEYVGSLPIKDHRAEVTLSEQAGGTRITWRVGFTGKFPLVGPLVRLLLIKVFQDQATRLARAAEAAPAP